MKIVIIGGSGHYPYVVSGAKMRTDMQIVGIAPGTKGENIENVRKACEQWQPREYAWWTDALDAERPDVAAIDPWFCDSAAITMECLRRGIHVYSEKPVATELPVLDRLEQAAAEAYEKNGTCLGCMLDGRHTPWLRTVKAVVDSGEIGEVRLLHGQKSYRMGSRTGVYEKRADYGGMLAWIAIHPVSWFRYVLDGLQPETVSAQTSDGCNRGFGELETTGCMLLRYPGGILASVNADFFRPAASARHDDDRIRVTGTHGMVEVRDGHVYVETDDTPMREVEPLAEENPFLFFADAIGTDAVIAQRETAIAVARVCLKGRDAADSGKVLEI